MESKTVGEGTAPTGGSCANCRPQSGSVTDASVSHTLEVLCEELLLSFSDDLASETHYSLSSRYLPHHLRSSREFL